MRALLEERPPALLPLLRIGLCLMLAFYRLPGEGRGLATALRRPHELMHVPIVDWLGLPFPPSAGFVEVAPALLVVLALLGAVGLCTRASLLALGALWIYVGAVRYGLGFFNHTAALPCQLVVVLALVPGVSGYSLDRWLLARLRRRGAVEWNPPAAVWGEKLVLFVVGSVYLAAGIAKLRYGAAGWLGGETLAFYLGGHATTTFWAGPLDVTAGLDWKDGFQIEAHLYQAWDYAPARWLASHPLLVVAGAWFALGVELGAVFALLAPAAWRLAWIVGAQLFHVVVALLMGPRFDDWQIILALLVPWREVGAALLCWRARLWRH